MALTATAQSALREPTWDEVIVPTLRKRLKDESSVLARRISAVSLGSADGSQDLYPSSAYLSHQEPDTPPNFYVSNYKPSAIPRPSLQQSRTAGDSPSSASRPLHPSRSRTLSQPHALDSPILSDMGAFTSGPSRSTSPMMNGKTTRIPISRGRTGSTSSYGQGSVNGSTSKVDPELHPVDERNRTATSHSTIRVPRRKVSELFNESAPFNHDSRTSSPHDFTEDFINAYRPSTESEERPFEHWYRGDVSRNGGVGELRVGKRDEMLDIANYGHTFHKPSFHAGHSNFPRSRSNSRGRDFSASRYGSRQRAESVDTPVRQSIYLDEDETAKSTSMVLDEQPPSDLEVESDGYDGYEDQEHELYEQDVVPHPNGTISSPSLALSGSQVGHPDTSRKRVISVSRIPTPTSQRQISPPPRTPTPTKVVRGISENGAASSTPSTPRSQRLPRSQSQPQTQGQRTPPTAKRKAKSPASTPSVSSAKKAKSKPPSAMRRTTPRKDENRRSIGQYPAPDGDDVMDAIPSWIQPVPSTGNWDDVVLPVVARKKGLDNHYATADGSPRPQKTQSKVYEPAPGTFGFDYSKYRRPQDTDGAETIPMNEFGQRTDLDRGEVPMAPVYEQPKPQSMPMIRPSDSDRERAQLHPPPQPSPPPFAHYASAEETLHNGESQMMPPPMDLRKVEHDAADEDGGAGCCKCVIM